MGSCAAVLDRRISKDGMVAVSWNHYSMPDTKRRRIVEVQNQPAEVRIVEDSKLIAGHQVLEGKNRCRADPACTEGCPASVTSSRCAGGPATSGLL